MTKEELENLEVGDEIVNKHNQTRDFFVGIVAVAVSKTEKMLVYVTDVSGRWNTEQFLEHWELA